MNIRPLLTESEELLYSMKGRASTNFMILMCRQTDIYQKYLNHAQETTKRLTSSKIVRKINNYSYLLLHIKERKQE